MSQRAGILISIGADLKSLFVDLNKGSKAINDYGRRLAANGRQLTAYYTLPLLGAAAAAVKFAGDLDMMERSLAVQVGSAAAAKEELERLRVAALAPGLEFRQAVLGSVRLQSMGYSADTARTVLLGLGKATELSAGGAEEFGRAMVQVVQMLSKGKLLAEDWRRVADAVPAVNKALSEIWGTTNIEQIRAQGVGAYEFVAKLTEWMNNAQGTGDSLKNTLENLSTTMWYLAANIGGAIVKTFDLNTKINELTKWGMRAAVHIRYMTDEQRKAVGWGMKLAFAIALLGPLKIVLGSIAWAFGGIATAAQMAYKAVLAFSKLKTITTIMRGLAAMGMGTAITFGAVGAAIAGAGLAIGTYTAAATGKLGLVEKKLGRQLTLWEQIKMSIGSLSALSTDITGGGFGRALAGDMDRSTKWAEEQFQIENYGYVNKGRADMWKRGGKAMALAKADKEAENPVVSTYEQMMADFEKTISQLTGDGDGKSPADVWKELAEALTEASIQLEITGDNTKYAEDRLSAYSDAFVKLKASGADTKDLLENIRAAQQEVAEAENLEKFTKVIEDNAKAVSEAETMYRLFGDETKRIESLADAAKTALIDLNKLGFGDSEQATRAADSLKHYSAQLRSMEAAAERTTIEMIKLKLNSDLRDIGLEASFTGDGTAASKARASAYQEAWMSAKKHGVGTASDLAGFQMGFDTNSAQATDPSDAETVERYKTMGEAIQSVFADTQLVADFLGTAIDGLGESFADMFSGGANASKKFIQSILAVAKALVKLIMMKMILSAMDDETIPNPFAKIAAAAAGGAILLGVIGALSKKAGATEMASGGFVRGRLDNVTIGEYIGANNNPEAVMRLDQLQSMLDYNAGGMNVSIEGVARGDDLHYIMRRAEYRQKRVGGPRIS